MTISKQISFFAFAVLAFSSLLPGTASAQAWAYYMNPEHQFSALFPGEPQEREITYETANGFMVPAHVFDAQRRDSHYSITVVDFSSQPGEMEGAVAHQAAMVRERGTPGYDEFAQLNGIPGHAISVVAPDGRQILSQMYLYETRLYIAEGNEPPNSPPAAHFTQSIDIHHPDGTSVNLNPRGETTRAEILQNRAREAEGQ
jgi:hypothetical protein